MGRDNFYLQTIYYFCTCGLSSSLYNMQEVKFKEAISFYEAIVKKSHTNVSGSSRHCNDVDIVLCSVTEYQCSDTGQPVCLLHHDQPDRGGRHTLIWTALSGT